MKGIIILSGSSGSGKDSFANALVSASIPWPLSRIAIAAKIKEVAASIIGCPVENFYYKKEKEAQGAIRLEGNPSNRDIVIKVGMAMRREFGPTIWLQHAAQRLDFNILNVVTDARLDEEIEFFRKIAIDEIIPFLSVGIYREGYEQELENQKAKAAHPSASFGVSCENIDYVVVNGSSINNLEVHALNTLKKLEDMQ